MPTPWTNIKWRKHARGDQVAKLPAGGRAHIIPRAFGGTKTRLRVFDHPLQPYFYKHQFYPNVREAKRVLRAKLLGNNPAHRIHRHKWVPQSDGRLVCSCGFYLGPPDDPVVVQLRRELGMDDGPPAHLPKGPR